MNQTSMQGTVIRVSALVLLLIAVFTIRPILLGGGQKVTLQSAPELTGQVSQAFATTATGDLPAAGKDYKLYNTKYLENDDWIVTNFKWLNEYGNDGVIVLQKKDGIYNPMLGPGSAFPSTVTETLPPSVSLYLNSIGVLYDPSE
jgi:hypothetical protein